MIINGITLSVVAGPGLYSSPRTNGTSPKDFDSFEIGVWDDNGWLTSELVDTNGDDVIGWQTIDDINNVIKKIEIKNELDSYHRIYWFVWNMV